MLTHETASSRESLIPLAYQEKVQHCHIVLNVITGSRKEEMRSQLASWSTRHKICLGIAHGLHYLHAMARPRVIHRDIKAGNILLNSHLEPKIADFGLALLFPDEESGIMTIHCAGTK